MENNSAEKEVERLIQDVLSTKFTPYRGSVYSVGGFVRDELLGVPSKDLDIVVELDGGAEGLTKYLHQLWPYQISEPRNLGKSYPIWHISFKEDVAYGFTAYKTKGAEIDVADTQKESFPDPKTRQRVTTPGTLEEDIARRDFSVNMLLRDLTTGEIKDLTGRGLNDLKNKILRGHPKVPLTRTFADDPLRMLRLIRFKCKYNFEIPYDVLDITTECHSRIEIISKERIQEELIKIMELGKLRKAVSYLMHTHLMAYIMPSFYSWGNIRSEIGFRDKQEKRYEEMLETLERSKPGVVPQLAALLYNIRDRPDNSAYQAEEILKSLKFENNIINSVTKIILCQNIFKDMTVHIASTYRQVVRQTWGVTSDVIDLHEARYPDSAVRLYSAIARSKKILPVKKSAITVNGNDVMEQLNIKGTQVGEALDIAIAVEDFLLNYDITPEKDYVLDFVKKWYEANSAK